ncbi:type I restriction endonuclease subunit M [Candidatus Poribacteria bacterium]|nr:MAG: type I restriction endonuclease subunit M [Candidatus Poribacteria bacterium]
MAIKKSQLYASLWQSCDELRGGMDASQYKDYILTLLFMKYISDKTETNSRLLIKAPEGGSFADMVELIGNPEIGDGINKIINKFVEENELDNVLVLADFNDPSKLGSGKEMVDRLSKLVAIFNDLDLGANRAEGDDLLGDAYEYLMRHFATESGKSKGQFYTPAEVSRIMAKVIGIGPETRKSWTIYDPTCGSGSLLIRATDEAPRGLTPYGQEKDNATYALALMNMIIHDITNAELWHGNTLSVPHTWEAVNELKRFDFAVANPPFSDKGWTSGVNLNDDPYNRFEDGIPPAKNGDYAFLLHFIASLKSTGKGAIILPHGVLFRGNKEADIRRKLIQRGYIKGTIGLPANLFYGTGIPACIIVIDKEKSEDRTDIFMIDASKGFKKDGNKNRLRAQDIHKIVSVFNNQTEIEGYSRIVPTSEIADSTNDYNLNIPRYIDNSEPEDLHDLDAHLNGGIPDEDIDELEDYWSAIPTLCAYLFEPNFRSGYSSLAVETQEIKNTIHNNRAFIAYQEYVLHICKEWEDSQFPLLLGMSVGSNPRKIIDSMSEDMLTQFADVPLLDPYGVYQELMDYWDDVMQDDVYLIATDGWVKASQPRDIIQEKNLKETPDLTIKKKKYKMDLIPPTLIIARYFADEQAEIDTLQTVLETATQTLDEYIEEHIGDEGLLSDVVNDSGNITKSAVSNRLKELTPDLLMLNETQDNDEEHDALEHCLSLIDAKSKADKAVKDAQLALDEQVLARYKTLTETEIKQLVIDDKWYATIQAAVAGEVQRLTQNLTERVKELEERYAQTLPSLIQDVQEFSMKVEKHLSNMRVDWDE